MSNGGYGVLVHTVPYCTVGAAGTVVSGSAMDSRTGHVGATYAGQPAWGSTPAANEFLVRVVHPHRL